MRTLKVQNKPRLRLESGRWFAYPGHGIPKRDRSAYLAIAIAMCNRMNQEQERKLRLGANHAK